MSNETTKDGPRRHANCKHTMTTEHGSFHVPDDGLSEGLGSEGAMMTKVTKLFYCVGSFRKEYDVTMADCGRARLTRLLGGGGSLPTQRKLPLTQ